MYSYPYDPTGRAVTNRFSEEVIVTSDDPRLRVIKLRHAPFFAPLTITFGTSNMPLTEGVDFEYVYELVELDNAIASPVFLGVNLLNPLVLGSVRFEGNLLGGSFYAPYYEMMDDLVKHLNNPVTASWLSVLNRPTLMPPMQTATSWEDLLNKTYLASAIRELKVGSEVANAIIMGKLNQLTAEIEAIYEAISVFNYPGHELEWNPHETSVEQIGAHPQAAKIPDAMLAFGRNLKTLTAEIRALGLKQADIDNYVAYNCFKGVSGPFAQLIAPNRPLFRSPNGETELIFTDTSYELRSNGSVIVAVGVDWANTSAVYVEWVIGGNVLRLSSSGSALGMSSLTLNGAALLNAITLRNYQSDGSGGGDPDDHKLEISGTNVNVTGKGSLADKVKVNLVIPTASTSVAGASKLQTAPGPQSYGYAAAIDAVETYRQQQSDFVLKETRINDKPMTGTGLTITKADIGLPAAENTSDAAKPLSLAQNEVLLNLAVSGHKHEWDTLGIGPSTADTAGVTKFATTYAGLAGQKAVAPAVLVDLANRVATLKNTLLNVDTSSVVDFAAVDASVWTVNASKTGISVTDMRYFYLQHGSRKEDLVSGTINFDTTPMFNWMMPGNVAEKLWPKSVASAVQLVPSLGALPTCSKTIGRTANEVGKLAYSSMLFKERVNISRGKLRVRVGVGGGHIYIYLNGDEISATVDTATILVDVDPDVEHTIGIRFDPDDPADPASIWYDILDDDYPVAYSRVGTPVGTLTEFYSPYGLRHYMYLNMITGSLFSRAEPALTGSIELAKMLLGYVDIPVGGLTVGAKINLAAMVDYGEFKELEAHAAKVNVHRPAKSDFGVSDAPNFAPKRLGAFHTLYKALFVNTGAQDVTTRYGGITFNADGSVGTPQRFQIGMDTSVQTPACCFVPNNPTEEGLNTVDGVFGIDFAWSGTSRLNPGQDLWFIIGKVTDNAKNPMVRFNPFTNVLEHTFSDFSSANAWGGNYVTGWATNVFTATLKVLETGQEAIPLTQFGIDDGSVVGQDFIASCRAIIRYRYIPTRRQLRLCYEIHRPGVEAIRLWRTYQLPLDLMHLFRHGVVGIERKSQTMKTKVSIQPSWFPMLDGTAAALQDKFFYAPALLDSYFSNGGLAQALTQVMDFSNSQSVGSPHGEGVTSLYGTHTTEFVAMPRLGGKVAHNHDMLWPAGCYRAAPRITVPLLFNGQVWDYTATDYKGIKLDRRISIFADVPSFSETATVDVEVVTNSPASLWLGERLLMHINPATIGTSQLFTLNGFLPAFVDNCKRNRLHIRLTGSKAAPVDGLFLTVKLTFRDGSTTVWTMAGNQNVYDADFCQYVVSVNPWGMTQRAMDMLRARVKAQLGT